MKEQTIYSYKLLYRFRWHLVGLLSQLLLLIGLVIAASIWTEIALPTLLVSLSIIVSLPIMHLLFFRIFAYTCSQTATSTPDMLFSAWWGAGSVIPLSLSLFRGAELTVLVGSLLMSAALYVWIPLAYGISLLIGSVVLAFPRLLALLMSLRQPKHCRVKYETGSVAFLLTDG